MVYIAQFCWKAGWILGESGEIWVGELCKEIRPPIDAILLSPSGSGYGVLMLSWPKPYRGTSEKSHMTHSILTTETNFPKHIEICQDLHYDVESSRQSAMVEKLYNFSDCDASRKCFLWLVGRVETVHKIMFFQSINGERMGCPWTTSQIDITTNVCQFWNRCPWSQIHEHNYTNTQIHNYTITQKIHKCLPVLKPITPVRPRSSCLVLRLVTARCESALVSPVTWEIRKYTNTQIHKHTNRQMHKCTKAQIYK